MSGQPNEKGTPTHDSDSALVARGLRADAAGSQQQSGQRRRDQCGVTTAEYSVGTLAATGFAGLLYLLWPWIEALIRASLIASGRFPTQIQGWRGM